MARFLLLAWLLIGSTNQALVYGTYVQEVDHNKPKAADDKNEYLARLRKQHDENKQLIEKVEFGSDFPNSLKKYYTNFFKPLEHQIEMAEDRIRRGLSFGKEEYEAAIKEMSKQFKLDKERRNLEADVDYQNTVENKEDDHRQSIEESQRKFDNVRRKSDQEYKLRINAANLKFKFDMKNSQAQLVIWNLPIDRKLHDRFTTAVNVDLYCKGKSVWSRKNFRLDSKEFDSHVALPKLYFDRVDIEIVEWIGKGGGLSEIEVYLGKENVAALRPGQVSNAETAPRYLDDRHALTDGVRVSTVDGYGYWIAEEGKPAIVSVDLIGELVSGQK